MDDLTPFAEVVLLLALTMLLALGSHRLADRLRIPAPALFLIVAALAARVRPGLGSLGVVDNQRIVTVALALILFDGGLRIGWGRMRPVAGRVAWLGVAGTVVTSAALAVGVHYLFAFEWRSALLIGAALAPTDPAVVFSVLGRREIAGPSGTVLEGESGANDPVGIALLISVLGATGAGWTAVADGVGHFALQLAVGTAVGLGGGWLLLQVMRRVPLPNEALHPVRSVAFALALYGLATVAGGSGYLAVFVAGILLGDERAPHKQETERFAGVLAGIAEIVAFVVLGLSVDLRTVFRGDTVWLGLGVAALLIVVVRPVLVGLLTLPLAMTAGERGFVLFSGLKGAVPILLGTYVLAEHAADAERIYDIVFVVVLVSVLGQGSLVPLVARVCRVPMRVREPEPLPGTRGRE